MFTLIVNLFKIYYLLALKFIFISSLMFQFYFYFWFLSVYNSNFLFCGYNNFSIILIDLNHIYLSFISFIYTLSMYINSFIFCIWFSLPFLILISSATWWFFVVLLRLKIKVYIDQYYSLSLFTKLIPWGYICYR